MDLYLDYDFRALFFETTGHVTLQNNITLRLEITSSYDSQNQKPVLNLTNFNVDYHSFNLLFGGSILAYLIGIFEGFCDCVVKEQYPALLQTVLQFGFGAVIDQINNKFLVDLGNLTELGVDLRLPQQIDNFQDHLSIYMNGVVFDPYEPALVPPQPSPLPDYNSTHKAIELVLNEGVLNSLLWTLNNQRLFDLIVKGDQIPSILPIQLTIDTKLFQLALPEFYNYYNATRIVDLAFSTNDTAPTINLIANDSISFQLNETVHFLVRMDDGTSDDAFTVAFSLDARINDIGVINSSNLSLTVSSLNFDNSRLVASKIPGLAIDGLNKMVNSMMNLVLGMVNVYLKTHPIGLPQIPGVILKNLEVLVRDGNVVAAVEPVLGELHPEILRQAVKILGENVHRIRV